MAIKIEMLRCFLVVAERGNLTDAADQLGRTPSAVSMMLRQFEDHIGAPLFESGRKSRLTRLGALIRIEASRELTHFQNTVAAIEGLSRAETGYVRVAITPSVAQTLLPNVLAHFVRTHPGVRVNIRDADSATVQQALLARRADIGIASIDQLPGFDRRLLFSDRFGVVCAETHPMAESWDAMTWADLQNVSFITNGLCDLIDDPEFKQILQKARLSVANMASILALVRADLGVTLLPELAVRQEDSGLAFLPLRDQSVRREIWLACPEAGDITPATQALVDVIQSQIPKIRPS